MPSGNPKVKFYSPVIAGSMVIALAIIVIIGWFLDIEVFKKVMDGYISMKLNTALSFLFIGIGLILAVSKHKIAHIVASFMEFFVFSFSFISISQDLLNINLGLDQLFIADKIAIANNEPYPGRMSPLTDICFMLISFGLWGARSRTKYLALYQILFHIVTLLAFIAIMGYMFNVPKLKHMNFVIPMAVHTAIGFFILSIGSSLINPTLGITGVFTGTKTGDKVAKRLFLQMLFAIVIITYIRLQSHKYNLVNINFGNALLAISFIVISLLFIWKAADTLNRADIKQKIAEEYFRLVVESAPNALIMSDNKGVVTLANLQAEKIFGYSREEMIGKKIEVFVPQQYRGHHPNNRNSYNTAPKARYFGAGRDLHAVRKDGSEFPVEIGLNPIKSNGETVILASVIDITERKKQEALIKRQLIELKIKNQEMEQFSYIASHDLQEPLRTVSNYIMLLEEDYPHQIEGEVKMHLQTIDQAVKRMSILVRSLLDFGKLGRNKKLVFTNCGVLVNNVIDDLSGLIVSTNANIIIDTELPSLFLYETEIRQLFQNLINNAIKFRKKDETPEIKIGYKKVEKTHEFYISDNGIGIEPKYFKRIFNIFQRLHKENEFEGHGIGLANCKKIVELHDGKIWVESEHGKGSTFYFNLSNLKNE